jgi:hypothetical protein
VSEDGEPQTGATPAKPLLRVVSGNPEPDELAALVAVLAARTSGRPDPAPTRRSLWASRSRQVRPALRPGTGAWRASTLPR